MTCKPGGGNKCQEYDTKSGKYGPGGAPRPVSDLPHGPMAAVPEYRQEHFRSQFKMREWVEFQRALQRLPNLSPLEFQAYAEIFAAEGGMEVNPSTGAYAGITQDALDSMIKSGFLPGVPAGTRNTDLTIEQTAQAYRAYFDDVFHTIGGHDALNRMLNDESARAVADAFFRHGRDGGARVVQKAVNYRRDIIPMDGRMGSGTLAGIQRINADPAQQKNFRNSLQRHRNILVHGVTSHGEPETGRESPRFSYFEFKHP